MPKYRFKPRVVDAVRWNVNGKKLGRECKDHTAVRGTSYMEVARMLGTSGCSKDEKMWDWARMGVLVNPNGDLRIVVPGDWIVELGEHITVVSPEEFEKTFELNSHVEGEVIDN